MGGNTALNAAGQRSGVKGIVLLAPCDIGTMTLSSSKEEMRAFLKDNGLGILKTDGAEAVYDDLVRHADEYSFPKAAAIYSAAADLASSDTLRESVLI